MTNNWLTDTIFHLDEQYTVVVTTRYILFYPSSEKPVIVNDHTMNYPSTAQGVQGTNQEYPDSVLI